ncbi:retrovirus-related pol polyprotein from transposon TNT 1-94 [Tanacetum coccineum]
MEETYHVTFNEADEVITQTNIKGDEINFNENISFPDDEFLVRRIHPSKSTIADDHHVHSEPNDFELAESHVNDILEVQDIKVNLRLVVIEALEEQGWVIEMQEELNQFERNKVWTLVPTPYGKTIIGTKWIFRNNMDENGVVIKNKARIFLAYAAYIGFVVYQMDVKSAFLNGKLSDEVYVQQPTRYQANPKESHLAAVKRIFRHLKGTPNLGVVFSTWMAFGGNTRNLGSFGEETDEITNLHQILKEVLLTERGDGITSIKRHRRDLFSGGVWNLETASGHG